MTRQAISPAQGEGFTQPVHGNRQKAVREGRSPRDRQALLFLAMPNLGPHPTLLAALLTPPFSRFLRSHRDSQMDGVMICCSPRRRANRSF
jgi:hypothetical protein